LRETGTFGKFMSWRQFNTERSIGTFGFEGGGGFFGKN